MIANALCHAVITATSWSSTRSFILWWFSSCTIWSK